ncbi:hypothetical protein BKA81DRAFT_354965 [Phyllosticta paracitricarpa]|uniref:Secreted protein n=1 Tax=Phyllosticta citricarpa TaxID=55181 RepID=A0ABR1MLM3_9PEZI
MCDVWVSVPVPVPVLVLSALGSTVVVNAEMLSTSFPWWMFIFGHASASCPCFGYIPTRRSANTDTVIIMEQQ